MYLPAKRTRLAPCGSVVIWITTPLTIPGNRAIPYNPTSPTPPIRRTEALPRRTCSIEPWAKPGDVLVLAEKLAARRVCR